VTSHPMQIQDELLQMPEWHRLAEIRQFSLSLVLFQRNAAELVVLIGRFRTGPAAIEIWGLPSRPKLEEFQIEVTRLVHNFVAASLSLVGHARRFYEKNYRNNKLFEDYEYKVKTLFAEDPLCQFVQGLRNYCLHKELPDVSSSLTFGEGQDIKHSISLVKKSILDFDWNLKARQFLDSALDEIDLLDTVNQYAGKVTDFYNWVFSRLEEIHAEDIKAVEKKQQELREAIAERTPNDLLAQLNIFEQIPFPPEDMFLQFIDPKKWGEIRDYSENPIERANAFFNYVEGFAPRVSPLRDQVVEAFKAFYKSGQKGK